MLIDLVRRSI